MLQNVPRTSEMLNDINNKEALIQLLHSFECSYHALTYYTLTAHIHHTQKDL